MATKVVIRGDTKFTCADIATKAFERRMQLIKDKVFEIPKEVPVPKPEPVPVPDGEIGDGVGIVVGDETGDDEIGAATTGIEIGDDGGLWAAIRKLGWGPASDGVITQAEANHRFQQLDPRCRAVIQEWAPMIARELLVEWQGEDFLGEIPTEKGRFAAVLQLVLFGDDWYGNIQDDRSLALFVFAELQTIDVEAMMGIAK